MAIIKCVNKPNRTHAGMKNAINYVLNPKKTNDNLISAIGLTDPKNAYDEMVMIKQLMGKTDKRLWYHFVQSFPPYDNITPELAQKIAHETTEYFREQYQILMVTHTDKKHIHTHFIMNTVNVETGKKYTQNETQMLEIKELSDKICEKYGLHTLSPEQKNNGNGKKSGEYRADENGISWKTKLKSVIDEVLSKAISRTDFIRRMEQKGYQVKWTDTRENITFTTPSGMKCRDRRLGEADYYNKHNFQIIFEQNAMYNPEYELVYNETAVETFRQFGGIAEFFGGDTVFQSLFDGFMLKDVDFSNMSYHEIEEIIERLQHEAETRKARALANETELERKVAEQAYRQRMMMLDDLEKRLLTRDNGDLGYGWER